MSPCANSFKLHPLKARIHYTLLVTALKRKRNCYIRKVEDPKSIITFESKKYCCRRPS